MGHTNAQLKTASIPPTVFILCGLQGSGKTTFAGKLALQLKTKGQAPLLVAADVYRPAAKDQLKVIGNQIGVPVFTLESKDAVKIANQAVDEARKTSRDTIIIDTAGRLHVDSELMKELQQIKKAVKPHEVFVCS